MAKEMRGTPIAELRKNAQSDTKVPVKIGRCELCGVDFPTEAQRKSHMNGMKHKENVRLRDEGRTSEIKKHKPKRHYYSSFNRLAPTFRQNVERGMRQNAMLKEDRSLSLSSGNLSGATSALCPVALPTHLPLADPYVEELNGVRRCTLCDVTFSSAIMEASHIQGDQHKLAAAEEGAEGEAEGADVNCGFGVHNTKYI